MTAPKINRRTATLWWPPVGLVAMVLLGLLVGPRSTTVDDWFLHFGQAHRSVYWLLVFTDARLLMLVFATSVAIALYRRKWRLAVVAAATPVLAVAASRLLKHLFGREKRGGLSYPSGHITVTIVVLGLLLLVLGASVWMFAAAVVVALLGLLGQAFTVHYFTDTLGAVLLSTSALCLAVLAAGLDTRQPRCDLDHSQG